MNEKDIINKTLFEWKRLDEKTTRKAYSQLRKNVRRRLKTIEKHYGTKAIPKKYKKGIPGLKSLKTFAQLEDAIGRLAAFAAGSGSRYGEIVKNRRKRREELKQRGIEINSEADLDTFDNFMDEMWKRYKDLMKMDSEQAVEMYNIAQEKNIGPKKLIKNFEYWLENKDALKNAKVIKGRNLKPSRYAKKLNLPKIKDWYEE